MKSILKHVAFVRGVFQIYQDLFENYHNISWYLLSVASDKYMIDLLDTVITLTCYSQTEHTVGFKVFSPFLSEDLISGSLVEVDSWMLATNSEIPGCLDR